MARSFLPKYLVSKKMHPIKAREWLMKSSLLKLLQVLFLHSRGEKHNNQQQRPTMHLPTLLSTAVVAVGCLVRIAQTLNPSSVCLPPVLTESAGQRP